MRWEMENNHTRLNWTLQRLMWNYGTHGNAMPLKYQIISLLGSNYSVGTERKHSNSMLPACDISQCMQCSVSFARYGGILFWFGFLLFVCFRLTHFVPAHTRAHWISLSMDFMRTFKKENINNFSTAVRLVQTNQ